MASCENLVKVTQLEPSGQRMDRLQLWGDLETVTELPAGLLQCRTRYASSASEMRRTGLLRAQVGGRGQPRSILLQCCRKEQGRPVGKAIGGGVSSFVALIVFGYMEGRYMRACRCLHFAIPEILSARAGCNSVLHKVVCGPVVKNNSSIMVERASSCF